MSKPGVTAAEEAATIVADLSDKSFWGERHRRDLMYSIRDRWADFPETSRHAIEQRILNTTFPWTDEQRPKAKLHDAQEKHALITWLSAYGLTFSFDVDAVLAKLAADANNELIAPAALVDSDEPRIFSIGTDKNPSSLLNLPLREVLQSSHAPEEIDFAARTRRDPFAGLVEEYPTRALSVLGLASRAGMQVSGAWRTFLRMEARALDRPRMVRLIAARLLRMNDHEIAEIDFYYGDWFKRLAPRLYTELPELFEPLWEKLLSTLQLEKTPHRAEISNRSWADDALNSAVGRLTEALFLDPRYTTDTGPLPEEWKTRFEKLLLLPGALRPQVVVLATFHLVNLFERDMDWIRQVLLPLRDDAKDNGDAFWDGFLWRNHAPQDELMLVMKRSMIALARHPKRSRSSRHALTGMLIYYWIRGSRGSAASVSNEELREVLIHGGDDLAGTALWSLEHPLASMKLTPSELQTFFEDVWPKQKTMRNVHLSRRLVAFALSSGEALPNITPVILPRLVAADNFDTSSFLHGNGIDATIERFPRETFALFLATLRSETAAGQYGLSRLLDKFAKAPELKGDLRLAKLRRRHLS